MAEDLLIFLATQVASTEVFIFILLLLAAASFLRKERRTGLLIILTTVGVLLSVAGLKEYFMIPRPDQGLITEDGFGYPSGHATGIVFLATVGWVFLRHALAYNARIVVFCFLLTLVLLIGASRVYLGVHTFPQVFGGYALGIFWSLLFLAFYRRQA